MDAFQHSIHAPVLFTLCIGTHKRRTTWWHSGCAPVNGHFLSKKHIPYSNCKCHNIIPLEHLAGSLEAFHWSWFSLTSCAFSISLPGQQNAFALLPTVAAAGAEWEATAAFLTVVPFQCWTTGDCFNEAWSPFSCDLFLSSFSLQTKISLYHGQRKAFCLPSGIFSSPESFQCTPAARLETVIS